MVGSERLGALVMATGWDFSVGQVERWKGAEGRGGSFFLSFFL